MKPVNEIYWTHNNKHVPLSAASGELILKIFLLSDLGTTLKRLVMSPSVMNAFRMTSGIFLVVPALMEGVTKVGRIRIGKKWISVFTVDDPKNVVYVVCDHAVTRIIMEAEAL